MCAHCHLFQASILPTFWKDVEQMRGQLSAVCENYFTGFDNALPHGEATAASAYCESLMRHISMYTERNRVNLSSKQVYDLHEQGSQALHVLRWSHKVLQAYEWHRRRAP